MMDSIQTIEFNWDWAEPIEDWGTGTHMYCRGCDGEYDWLPARSVRAIPSYEQETFNNGMDLLLFRVLPIVFLFLAIWVASYYA